MTGLWVIAHECGHGGFSDSELVNDLFGWIVHCYLLVPFFSWKISHRRHHSNTGNVDRDEVFVPQVRSDKESEDDNEEPLSMIAYTLDSLRRIVGIFAMLTLGWPLYLFFNCTGHPSYPKGLWVNHFLPSSPIFTTEKERIQVILSDFGLLLFISIFSYLSFEYGFLWFFKVYGVPYLITNLFLVLITFLQHTDKALPHYSGTQWDWLRGALATVDRDYGYLNYFHHHIADTHVVHHLFSSMPHYHAEEATRAVKSLLGRYYRFDSTSIVTAIWKNFVLDVVDHDKNQLGVLWFK